MNNNFKIKKNETRPFDPDDMSNLGKESKLESWFVSLLFFGGFYGIYVILSICYGLGLYEYVPLINIAFRATFLLLSGCFFAYAISKKLLGLPFWFYVLSGIFWTLWLLRLFIDAIMEPIPLQMAPNEYFLRGILMAAVPMLAFAAILGPHRTRIAFYTVYGCAFLFVLLGLWVYRSTLGISDYRSLQWHGVDTVGLMSPLIISYNGAALASLGLWALTNIEKQRLKSLLHLASVAMGAFMVILGGSRGPMLVMAGVFIVLIVMNFRSKAVFKRLLILIGAAILIVSLALLHPRSREAFNRVFTLVEQVKDMDEAAGGGRGSIYAQALQQFSASPFMGNSLVVETTLTYPHNYLLEALMTTGVVGGIPFLLLFFYAAYKSVQLQGRQNPNGWLGVLYLNTAIGGMFSFSLINNLFWFALVAVIANTRCKTDTTPVCPPKPNRLLGAGKWKNI